MLGPSLDDRKVERVEVILKLLLRASNCTGALTITQTETVDAHNTANAVTTSYDYDSH